MSTPKFLEKTGRFKRLQGGGEGIKRKRLLRGIKREGGKTKNANFQVYVFF